jgi:hypothetical protein
MTDDNSLSEFKHDKIRCRNILTYLETGVEPNVPELNINTISTRCNWLKIRVCVAVRWEGKFIGEEKRGKRRDIERPQLQLKMVDG